MFPDGVKPVWAGAQGDRAGLGVDREGTPVNWVSVNKWFHCRDLILKRGEDMLWHPMRPKIQDWFDQKLRVFDEK